jgi:hypothetical protein
MEQVFNIAANFIVIQKSDNSNSYHIYGNFACTLLLMKYIVVNINKHIDMCIYKPNRNFRLCNSFKYDITTKKTTKTYYEISKETFKQTLITNIQDLQIIENPICLIKNAHINSTVCNSTEVEMSDEAINKLRTYIVNVEVDEVNSTKFIKKTLKSKQPYKCPRDETQQLEHNENNGFIFTMIQNNVKNTYYKCYSPHCANLKSLLLSSTTVATNPNSLENIINNTSITLDDI